MTIRRLLPALALLQGVAAPAAGQTPERVVIGVVIDGPWERNDLYRDLFHAEILALTEGEFDVVFPPEKEIVADWTPAGVAAALDRLYADPAVDLVLAVGPLGSLDAARRGPLPTPTIAAFGLDPELAGLPRDGPGSGVENLAYVTHPTPFSRDLEAFRDAAGVRSVAVLASPTFRTVVPERVAAIESAAARLGLSLDFVPVADVDAALAALPEGTDGVYLAPMLHLPPGETERLLAGLVDRRIPAFAIMGRMDVERGAYLSLTPDTYFPRVARRVALDVQRILLGEPASTIPVDFRLTESALLNLDTARAIGVLPPWDALAEAETIGDEVLLGPEVSIRAAVAEAVAANLALAARERETAAGLSDVARARSTLLPRADLSTLSTRIEKERADASLGIVPEHRTTASVTASQVIWSEPAWANLSVQRRLQEARELDEAALRLDVARDAATAYLVVLAAEAAGRIEKENVAVTRAHLATAGERREVGDAHPSEVYRWRSELATARRRLVEATARTGQARVALARLLHRPQGEPFRVVDVRRDDPVFVTGRPGFEGYVSDPARLELFGERLVADAIAASPEIRRLDALLEASDRALASATRSFFSPTVALQAQAQRTLEESGSGLGAGFPIELPEDDDSTWSLALSLSVPLWTSGERMADRSRAAEESAGLRLQRAAVAELVEQRVRTALEAATASWVGIDLARESAEAASRSLELVEDGYARGALSILDLLDAQNVALAAGQAAAASEYEFLVDLVELERAVGREGVLADPHERDDWFDRLDEAYRRAGLAPREPSPAREEDR